MAKQDTVRALVPNERAERLRDELLELDDADVASVTISAPDPATYREETSERQLRHIVRYGWWRLLLGAVVGAAIGVVVALVTPIDWLIYTVPILAFGGAWAGAIASTARGVQVAKEIETPDTEDRKVDVDPESTDDLRVLTIIVVHDREAVVDVLEREDDVLLLDSWHPKVGHGPDARPEDPSPEG